MQTIRVAIDGPSGAGKSTLARAAAADLGFLYVDTGAIYRTVGLFVQENGLDAGDAAAVAAALPGLRPELCYDGEGRQRMLLNGRDVSEEIRLPEISRYASAVSALPPVRAYLLDTQRELARKHSVIMDGRDIGTVVLPDAEVKIFLTASAQVRAERRCRELEERGTPQPFPEVLRDIESRDYRDTHRAAAPLRQAEDAVLLDTSALSFQESRETLLRIIRERTGL
ncbi:MAG: (d)CMP kinase [Oscillibacter sp.]|nr:(d)CMP kinase [Oscillibacter sp.]MCI9003199.1 (d)CMP kinase [Oscillibacter sp.]